MSVSTKNADGSFGHLRNPLKMSPQNFTNHIYLFVIKYTPNNNRGSSTGYNHHHCRQSKFTPFCLEDRKSEGTGYNAHINSSVSHDSAHPLIYHRGRQPSPFNRNYNKLLMQKEAKDDGQLICGLMSSQFLHQSFI